jgi:xylose isomerase
MDCFARGLIIADRILADSRSSELREGRYASFDSGNGKRFENGELSLTDLRDLAVANGEPEQISGKQELYENLINDYIVRGAI